MTSWAKFERDGVEFATAGRRLLASPDPGVSIAFLATVAADGQPRITPVCPIFTDENLYLCVTARSPKRRELERGAGRYALHAFLAASDEEFQLFGNAAVVPGHSEIASVHASIRFNFNSEDPIFRLDIARCHWALWENAGKPNSRLVRRVWRASDAAPRVT